jgi:myo-inositol 2-dehydrogenase / D-chiro-inositol 1-dehydrogenase
MTVNVGVIGVGMIGQEHIRRLTTTVPGANVVAVSDVDEARAREAAELLTGVTVWVNGEDLILARDVEAVIVASWGPTHAAFVLAAIKAGKPVFCEKPLATAEEDCLAIIDAETAFGRRLVQVGFMRRFDAQYLAMKETIASGAIGAPLIFQSVHRNASVPAHYTGDMALTDTAVHDIDIARFLLDDEPAAITVRAPRRNSRAGDVADPLMTLIDMHSGALVAIETSVHVAYGYDIRGEVIGESGAVSLAERNDVVVKANGAFMGRVPVDWRERFGPAFDAEFRAFIAAASEGRVAGPSSWDGYVATVASAAGVKALKNKKREPIKLRRRPRLYAES